MRQIRIHGRGGQGVVTATELLSVAAFIEGRHAQAFPSFGSERTGAPVVAFCRIGDQPIRTREPVLEPDVLIVQDATLLHQVDVFAGLRSDGYLLINSSRTFADMGVEDIVGGLPDDHAVVVPATELAMTHVGRPLPNACLLGGWAALDPLVSLESVVAAIRERFPGRLAESNIAAARAAHDHVRTEVQERAHA